MESDYTLLSELRNTQFNLTIWSRRDAPPAVMQSACFHWWDLTIR